MKSYRRVLAGLLAVALLKSVQAYAADSFFEWIGAVGGGDGTTWFSGDNWHDYASGVTGNVPFAAAVWINNGDTVVADIADKGGFGFNPTRISVGSADGTNPGVDPSGTNVLHIIGLNAEPQNALRVGYNDQIQQAVSAVMTVTNGSLGVGEAAVSQIGMAVGDLNGSATVGHLDVSGTFTAPATPGDAETTLTVGRYDGSLGGTGRAVGDVIVGGGVGGFQTIHVGYQQNVTGFGNSATGRLTVLGGGLGPKRTGPGFGDSTLVVGYGSGPSADAVGEADITGDIVDFVTMNIANASGDLSTRSTGRVTLRDSHATIGSVHMCVGTFGAEAMSGSLDLHDSLLECQSLAIRPGGRLTLHLGGTNRVTASTVGSNGCYAAINGADPQLSGGIVADFGFAPPDGTSTFDLIVTATSNALDDTVGALFSVTNLPAGFAVQSFGVVETGGVDIVRLVVVSLTPPTVVSIVPETLQVPANTNSLLVQVTFSEPVTNFDSYLDVVIGAQSFDDGFSVSVLTPAPTNVYNIRIGNFIVSNGVTNGTLTVSVATNSDIMDLEGNPLASTVTSAVVQVSANAYQLWALSYGLSGTNFVSSADADGDGNDNATEFMRGTDPTSGGDAYPRRLMAYPVNGTNCLTLTIPVPKDYTYTLFGPYGHFLPAPVRAIEAQDELRGSDDLMAGFPAGGVLPQEVVPALDGPVPSQPDLPSLPVSHEYRTIRLTAGTNNVPHGFLRWESHPFGNP